MRRLLRQNCYLACVMVIWVGCDSETPEELCARFGLVPDLARDACRCPDGTVELADGTGCQLMDGGVIRFPDASTGGIDAGSGACVDGDERVCTGGTDQGECRAARQSCTGGVWSECGGEVGPTQETCNGLDDDCDGVVDGPAASATCVMAARATGVGCSAGRCIITECASSWDDCDEDPSNGCEVALGTAADCLGCGDRCSWSTCRESGCSDAIQVGGGATHTCAVREGGSVVCWGSTPGVGAPALVPGLTGARLVESGGNFSCALLASGEVWCWGNNVFGNLGNGTSGEDIQVAPVRVQGLVGVSSLAVGRGHACATLEGGEVRCWGGNDDQQLGAPSPALAPTAVAVAGIPPAVSVHAGAFHTCAIVESGAVWCWGRDSQGQLGGRDVSGRGPGQVRFLTGVETLALGLDHSCALLSTGSVQCWGDNALGQLGNDGGPDSRNPVPVASLSDVSFISAGGGSHTCAIQDEGVWCWGFSTSGQAGSTAESVLVPTRVDGLTSATSLGVGRLHSCAVDGGRVWCWGYNSQAELGMTEPIRSSAPLLVPPVD